MNDKHTIWGGNSTSTPPIGAPAPTTKLSPQNPSPLIQQGVRTPTARQQLNRQRANEAYSAFQRSLTEPYQVVQRTTNSRERNAKPVWAMDNPNTTRALGVLANHAMQGRRLGTPYAGSGNTGLRAKTSLMDRYMSEVNKINKNDLVGSYYAQKRAGLIGDAMGFKQNAATAGGQNPYAAKPVVADATEDVPDRTGGTSDIGTSVSTDNIINTPSTPTTQATPTALTLSGKTPANYQVPVTQAQLDEMDYDF